MAGVVFCCAAALEWLELSFHLACSSKSVDIRRRSVQKVAVAHIRSAQPPTRPKPAVNEMRNVYGMFSNPYGSHLMTQPSCSHFSDTCREEKKKKKKSREKGSKALCHFGASCPCTAGNGRETFGRALLGREALFQVFSRFQARFKLCGQRSIRYATIKKKNLTW